MVVLWRAVITAIILAVGFLTRQATKQPAGVEGYGFHPDRVRVGGRLCSRRDGQRRTAPPIDVVARTALIAKLFHRRHMIKLPERSSHG
jgi:hypothetical protein